MKKNMHQFLRAAALQGNFKPSRLVFDVPGQPEQQQVVKKEAAPLSAEAQKEQKKAAEYDAALGELAKAKDDPKQLEKALRGVMDTQAAKYDGKNADAIQKGGADLERTLKALGVAPADIAKTKGEFDQKFEKKDWLGDKSDAFKGEMDAATQKEAEALLPGMKDTVKDLLKSQWQPKIDALDATLKADDVKIAKFDDQISTMDTYGDKLTILSDRANNEANQFLTTRNIDSKGGAVTKEMFRALALKTQGDEDGADPAAVESAMQRSFDAYNKLSDALQNLKGKIKENDEELKVAKSNKKNAEDVKVQDRLKFNIARDSLRDLNGLVDKGTYIYADGRNINQVAQDNAKYSLENTQAEKDVMEKYAKASQEKVGSLVREAVVKQLEKMNADQVAKLNLLDGTVKMIDVFHDKKIGAAEAEMTAKLAKWGESHNIPGLEQPGQFHTKEQLRAKIIAARKDKITDHGKVPEAADEAELNRYGDRLMQKYDEIAQKISDAKGAKEGDPEKASVIQQIAKLEGSKTATETAIASLSKPPAAAGGAAGQGGGNVALAQ